MVRPRSRTRSPTARSRRWRRSPARSRRSTMRRSLRTTASRWPKTASITVDVLGNDSDVDGDGLTITHVERRGHHGWWSGGLRHERHGRSRVGPTRVHAGGQLPRSGELHLHDHRRVGLGGGDGQRHGDAGQRCAGGSERQLHGREDGSITVDVLGNDSDVDGDGLTITHVNGTAITDGGPAVAVINGSVQLCVGPARVHAGGQLPRSGLVHLHDHRRHGLGRGDGQRHGDAGQRRAGGSERQLHGRRRRHRSRSTSSATTATSTVTA